MSDSAVAGKLVNQGEITLVSKKCQFGTFPRRRQVEDIFNCPIRAPRAEMGLDWQ